MVGGGRMLGGGGARLIGCARRLPGTLRRRGARGRHRRTPQCGQDDAVQRADEGGRGDHRVRVPDGQVERRHGDDRRRRLERLAELVGAKKVTPAAIRMQDVPGTGPALLGGLRQVDALLAVTDGFSPERPGERHRDAEARAPRRRHRPRREAPRTRGQAGEVGRSPVRKEAEVLREVLAHLEAGLPLTEWEGELPEELDPLTTKPLLAIENGPAGSTASSRPSSPSCPTRMRRVPRRPLGPRRGRAPAQGCARPDHVLHRG